MAKNRSYGDRGTGYTPRKQSIPGTSNEKRFGRGARWCKRCGTMFQRSSNFPRIQKIKVI